MEWLVGITVLLIVFGMLSAWIAGQKNRATSEGFMLGLLFGPLGVLVEALLPQGSSKPNQTVTTRSVAGGIDEEGIIAEIAARFRDRLEEADRNWQNLSYREKRGIIKTVEKQIMTDLRLSPSRFIDLSAKARNAVFGSGN